MMLSKTNENPRLGSQRKSCQKGHHFHRWELGRGLPLTNGQKILNHLTRNAFEHSNCVPNLKEVAFGDKGLEVDRQDHLYLVT